MKTHDLAAVVTAILNFHGQLYTESYQVCGHIT